MNEQQQQQQQVVINVNDIATVVQLIDIISRRGAFQGNELVGVGMLRNKFEAFVQQNSPQQDMQSAAQAPVDVSVPPQGPLSDKVVS